MLDRKAISEIQKQIDTQIMLGSHPFAGRAKRRRGNGGDIGAAMDKELKDAFESGQAKVQCHLDYDIRIRQYRMYIWADVGDKTWNLSQYGEWEAKDMSQVTEPFLTEGRGGFIADVMNNESRLNRLRDQYIQDMSKLASLAANPIVQALMPAENIHANYQGEANGTHIRK